jgi:hypothetical protein
MTTKKKLSEYSSTLAKNQLLFSKKEKPDSFVIKYFSPRILKTRINLFLFESIISPLTCLIHSGMTSRLVFLHSIIKVSILDTSCPIFITSPRIVKYAPLDGVRLKETPVRPVSKSATSLSNLLPFSL